jgi:6-phosphogluconolactonase
MSPVRADIQVVDDPAAAVADRLADAAASGRHIALAGGSTPKRAYELTAERDLDWTAATLWFGDERCVPPDHPDSNFAMANSALLERLPAERRPRVHRIEGERGPDAAADAYEALLRAELGHNARLDLVLLGLGPDAHTASLFPGKPAIQETRRLVAPVPEAGLQPYVPRVTLTLPAINTAREVLFLISGEDKALAVARAFEDPPDPDAPSAHVDPAGGSLIVLLDQPAAGRLS